MALITYSALAIGTGTPFFQEGEKRLDFLWQIYMTPMFDEEPVLPLAFSALVSLGLSLLYFSKWFSGFSSRPFVGRICAALSLVLLLNAITNFSRPVVIGFSMATFFSFWAWWRSDPEDNWL